MFLALTYVIKPKVMLVLLSYKQKVTALITRMVRENRIQSRPTIMKALQYMEWNLWCHCSVTYFVASPNGPDHWLSAGWICCQFCEHLSIWKMISFPIMQCNGFKSPSLPDWIYAPFHHEKRESNRTNTSAESGYRILWMRLLHLHCT